MSDVNQCHLSGNLVSDPKVFGKESNVVRFRIACNNGFGDKRTTAFVDCVGFGKQAESIPKHFQKGSKIFVNGYLDTSEWEDGDGNKKSRLELKLSPMSGWQFFDSKGSRANSDEESPPEEEEMF